MSHKQKNPANKEREELQRFFDDLLFTGGAFAWTEPNYLDILTGKKSISDYDKWLESVSKRLGEIEKRNKNE